LIELARFSSGAVVNHAVVPCHHILIGFHASGQSHGRTILIFLCLSGAASTEMFAPSIQQLGFKRLAFPSLSPTLKKLIFRARFL
jgi:hypothetical protein